jgi:Nif-specific regulatory protein
METKVNKKEIKELYLLFDISKILEENIELKSVIDSVLKVAAEQLGMHRAAITLLNRQTNEIFIESAYGLSNKQQKKGRYKLGEGITGKVIKTGKPIVIPDIAKEPEFLDRTEARSGLKGLSISFICIPIKTKNETVGAFSVDRLYSSERTLEEDVRILTIISVMIAQAVQIRRNIQEEKQRLLAENDRLRNKLKNKFQPSNIIGRSAAMQEVFDLVAQVAKSEASVLIRGENGTGKELVANAIHYNSLRADKPFIKVNCAALPETIIESELFGHEKGAYTGASSMRKGRFEFADTGTIFLDEIGELSPTIQVKLLRVLQEREFERVGGNVPIKFNVRIITATNKNLEKLIDSGEFREDLYYRLNVFPIHIPPLRERKSDIMLLVDHFIEKYNKQNNKTIKRISTPAIELLMSYHWPGNVRELENCIERASLLSTEDVIHGHHLPPSLQSAESTGTGLHNTLDEAVSNYEKNIIIDAIKTTRGNLARAARELGITERIMGLRVKKYNINSEKYK